MAPLEPWEKVLVDGEAYPQTEHGAMPCTDCHAGEPSPDLETAHTGLIARPSADAEASCGECHAETVAAAATSLHTTLQGYWTALSTRSGTDAASDPVFETMMGNHCTRCHTTCGDCHVSQPASVAGGLLDGHNFDAQPSMTRTCTACHGSRVGNEYLGKNEELPGDVHFRQARMLCADCHTGAELHGEASVAAAPAQHRYEGAPGVECANCHAQAAAGKDKVQHHELHTDKLACQVCHSITYTSCDGCHVAVSDQTGNPYFETEATYATFLIGRNPLQSEARPYAYVPVRHVPIAPTSFEHYGDNLLPDFAAASTWKYATPHNIQRQTPQTETCNNCHGNAALFLTVDKVDPAEVEANQPVIVEIVPAALP